MEKITIELHTFGGAMWTAAWLFTIGFLHLGFWKGVLAIISYMKSYYFSGLIYEMVNCLVGVILK